jgi:hypothetical protein
MVFIRHRAETILNVNELPETSSHLVTFLFLSFTLFGLLVLGPNLWSGIILGLVLKCMASPVAVKEVPDKVEALTCSANSVTASEEVQVSFLELHLAIFFFTTPTGGIRSPIGLQWLLCRQRRISPFVCAWRRKRRGVPVPGQLVEKHDSKAMQYQDSL